MKRAPHALAFVDDCEPARQRVTDLEPIRTRWTIARMIDGELEPPSWMVAHELDVVAVLRSLFGHATNFTTIQHSVRAQSTFRIVESSVTIRS